jgi:type IV secretory pathway VirB4 component
VAQCSACPDCLFTKLIIVAIRTTVVLFLKKQEKQRNVLAIINQSFLWKREKNQFCRNFFTQIPRGLWKKKRRIGNQKSN